MNDRVEVIEIWRPVETGGEAYSFERKQNLKLVAFIVGGYPVRLEDGLCMERREVTKEEERRLRITLSPRD